MRAEVHEVKSVGSLTSTTRSQDQTDAPRYWATHPRATWSRIFRALEKHHYFKAGHGG
jgi:hypothetical protein